MHLIDIGKDSINSAQIKPREARKLCYEPELATVRMDGWNPPTLGSFWSSPRSRYSSSSLEWVGEGQGFVIRTLGGKMIEPLLNLLYLPMVPLDEEQGFEEESS